MARFTVVVRSPLKVTVETLEIEAPSHASAKRIAAEKYDGAGYVFVALRKRAAESRRIITQ